MSTEQRFPKRKPEVQMVDFGGRVLPHNDEAEAAVLSAVLTDQRAMDHVLEILPSGEPFYVEAHRKIFDVAMGLHEKSQPVDVQTVAAVLRDRDQLTSIGGLAFLARILDATPAVAHVAAHATIVRDKWRGRKVIETCQMISAEGYGD